MCAERARGCRWREVGEKETGEGGGKDWEGSFSSREDWTWDGVGSWRRKLSRGDVRLRAVSVVPNPVLGGTDWRDGVGARAVGRTQKQSHASLLSCFVCLFIKEKQANWNCP